MAYIGIQPAEKFTSFATQEFSTSPTTSYTLDHAVANENEIALFVNNVRQQPGSGKAYTASGTALTLSAATASTDTMYCIFLGRALQTVVPATNSIKPAMLSLDDGVTITTDDNSDTLTLTSTDTDANSGPKLNYYRNSSSPADSDYIGNTLYVGRNDNSENVNFVSINVQANDVSDGTEDASYIINTIRNGASDQTFNISPTEVIINEDSKDIDFRVESDGSANALFVQGSSGDIFINSTSAISGDAKLSVTETANDDVVQFENTNASLTERVLLLNAHRAANSGYQFLLTYSGDLSDLEHNLRGDGQAYADGSWNGGGADYAEYFEWKDGNTSDEVRVGISVKLDGDKIVASSDSDNASDIIGVISANPSMTGDSAWNKWNKKYLKDDYGRYKLDGNGERTLNPNYDKEKTYIAREDRKEWGTVGLMGKLRIKKGQKTGTNWIKMRDISSAVEEWLVR